MFLFAASDTLQGVAGTATAMTVTVSGVNVTVATGAEVFGLLYQGQLPSSAGVLFTVPAGHAYIVKTIIVTNSTGSSVAGVQLFQGGAAAANSILGPITFAGHYTLTGSENGWAMTDAAGVLQISSSGGGGGTVTSVGLSMPAEFNVTGSPVTGVGTLTAAKANQNQNLVWAGPSSGSPAAPTFRTLVTADLPAISGTLLNIQTITAAGAGSYTPTAGTNSIIIELVGGGGGGGALASPGSNVALATGGQGGGWLRKRLTSGFGSATYVVGALGTGGAAGNNNGNAGTDTTFTVSGPTTYTAKGGTGGGHLGPFSVAWQFNPSAGNVTTGGDISQSGSIGAAAQAISAGNGNGGWGGFSKYSEPTLPPGLGGTNFSAAGINADGYGGGGSGAVASGSGGAVAGGNGSAGLIIIYEYS